MSRHCMTVTKNRAFSLAEILIALAAIGIVAALTIPNIISNYRKQVVVTSLKKNYALLSAALKSSEADNGLAETWYLPDCTTVNCSAGWFNKYLKPYLKIEKICVPASSECWTHPRMLSGVYEDYLAFSYYHSIAFILNNGTSVYLWASGFNPQAEFDRHVQIWFDIDGKDKGAAMVGKDVFGMYVNFDNGQWGFISADRNPSRQNLMDPADKSACNINAGHYAGRYCAKLIEIDGWKIKDDYPVKF